MSRRRRLWVALLLNLALVAGEAGAGYMAHSVGLLAEAGHNLTDAAAVVLSLTALRLTLRSPTPSRTFGWHRSTILAAQANATAVVLVALVIAVGAVQRLVHPEAAHGGIMAAASVVALAVNAAAARVLHEPHAGGAGAGARRDLNMRANVLHMAGDSAASAGVALAGLIILFGGPRLSDPAVSLAIAALVAWEGVGLVRESAEVLLESTPADVDLDQVAAVARSVGGVEDVHDLHVWSLSSEVRALSAHLVLAGHPSLEEAQATGGEVKLALARRFGIGHSTLELECETCVAEPAEGEIVTLGTMRGHSVDAREI
jgi:cobalt-zinc-cadmium efflux system protein